MRVSLTRRHEQRLGEELTRLVHDEGFDLGPAIDDAGCLYDREITHSQRLADDCTDGSKVCVLALEERVGASLGSIVNHALSLGQCGSEFSNRI